MFETWCDKHLEFCWRHLVQIHETLTGHEHEYNYLIPIIIFQPNDDLNGIWCNETINIRAGEGCFTSSRQENTYWMIDGHAF